MSNFNPKDASLANQLRHRLKSNNLRNITGDIYDVTLSKQESQITKQQIITDLERIGFTESQVQYIEQNPWNVHLRLTIPQSLIDHISSLVTPYLEVVDADYNNTGQYRIYFREADKDGFMKMHAPDLDELPQLAEVVGQVYLHFD